MLIVDSLLIVLVLVVIVLLASQFWKILIQNQAPFINTSKEVINKALDEVKLNKDMVVYELGCGNAKFLRQARLRNSEIKLVGYELFLFPYLLGRLQNFFTNANIEIKRNNFYQANLAEADIIYCYLNPLAMKNLVNKFAKELKTGTIIISYQFSIPGFKPDKEIKIKNGRGRIFIYLVKSYTLHSTL